MLQADWIESLRGRLPSLNSMLEAPARRRRRQLDWIHAAGIIEVMDCRAMLSGFSLSTASIAVSEDGSTDSFSIVLDEQPLSDVVFVLSGDDASELLVSPTTLTFTNGNWDVAQEVSVAGIDDELLDGTQSLTLTIAVDPELSDDAFDAVASQSVAATNADNDVAGFTLSRSTVSVTEAGSTDEFTVVLNREPITDVVLLVANSDASESSQNPTTLTFMPGNWDVPQAVTVTGAADEIVDGTQTSIITVSVDDASSDDRFDNLADQTVTATTSDKDSSVSIVATNATQLEGDSDPVEFTFTVTRNGDTSGTASIDFEVFGSGLHAADVFDFSGSSLPTGSLGFDADETTKTITVVFVGDTNLEPTEGFTVALINSIGMTIATQTADGSIINDEASTAVSVSNGRLSLTDGDRVLQLQATIDSDAQEIALTATEVVFFDDFGNATDELRFDESSINSIEMSLGDGADVVDLSPLSLPMTIAGGAGDDSLTTGSGDDVLVGESGNDDLDAGAGADLVGGGAGDDEVFGRGGADTLLGSDGNDTLAGGGGPDSLNGGGGDDTLRGNSGHDVLTGSSGNDRMLGGFGIDTLQETTDSETVTASKRMIVGLGSSSLDTEVLRPDIERISITGGDSDNRFDFSKSDRELILNGGSGNDTILGGSGDDALTGASGDDVLIGSGGNDALSGGRGNDTLIGGRGDDGLRGHSGDDTLLGESGSDRLTGDAGLDVLTGGGNDNLVALNDIVTDAEDGEIDDAFSLDLVAILGV